MSTLEKFHAAVDVIRGLPKQGSFQPSSEMQLKFYSFYKQATQGPCRNPKPSFWNIVEKAKWDAWKALGTMPKEEAMEKYVDELKEVIKILKEQTDRDNSGRTKEQIVETMSYTDSVSKFLDLLGPFYESVPLEQEQQGKMGPKVNGDSEGDVDISKQDVYIKGEKNGPGNGHVNGFGDPGEIDSDGDEFSDTYDNIKEPLDDGDSFAHGDGGDGDAPDSNSSIDSLNGAANNRLLQEDCAFPDLNTAYCTNGHCYEDSPARHSHPTMSRSHSHRLLSHDHSYSQPLLLQEGENHIWAVSREDLSSAVRVFKTGDDLDGIVQARGGSDQGLGNVNPRANSSTSSGTGAGVHGRAQRNRIPRETTLGTTGDRVAGPGGSGGSPGGSPHVAGSYSDVNDQLALAVIKLQHSMDEVNTRLVNLESALSGKNSAPKAASTKTMKQYLGVSPQVLLLILAWPFVAHWVIHLIRKRNGR